MRPLLARVAARARGGGAEGVGKARDVADRLIGWSTCIAAVMALGQALTIPLLVPLFSTLPEVRSAVAKPAMVSALVQQAA